MAYKRFLLFAYDKYYPCGGVDDVADSFDTLAEAQAAGGADSSDFADVLDMDTREFVWRRF